MGAGDEMENDDEMEDEDDIAADGFDLGDGNDSEDDLSLPSLQHSDDLLKQIDALKRACVLSVGSEDFSSKSNLSVECKLHDNEDESEDDDELLLSIQSMYGSSKLGTSVDKETSTKGLAEKEEDAEDEEDDEILRSVTELHSGDGKEADFFDLPSPGALLDAVLGPPSPLFMESAPEDETPLDDDNEHSIPRASHDPTPQPTTEVGQRVSSLLPSNWNMTAEDGYESPSQGLLNEYVPECRKDSDSSTGTKGLSGDAKVLAEALAKNRHCQRILKNDLMQLEVKLKHNAELQKQVKNLVIYEKRLNRRKARSLAGQGDTSGTIFTRPTTDLTESSAPRANLAVRNLQSCKSLENADTETFDTLKQEVSFSALNRRWTDAERVKLVDGIKQQIYISMMDRMLEEELDAADDSEVPVESLEEKMSRIGGKDLSAREIGDFIPEIDWGEVAKVYLPGRRAEECQSRWFNHEDRLVNRGTWTKQEDKKLLNFAQQLGQSNWEDIARRLGTNRTAAMCLVRYQRSLNPYILKKDWTEEADSQLRAAVAEVGENDWIRVATMVEGRTGAQCLARWLKVVGNKRKRGRWSVDEDKRLMWAVSVYGKKWVQAAKHVPGRTDMQCRERWCNVLDPDLILGEWTPEEDKRLEAAVAKHGMHHWATIAQDVRNRTDSQCSRRWQILHPEDQLAFRRNIHIRKVALRGNFQGRRKERSKLCPDDFISRAADATVLRKPTAESLCGTSPESSPLPSPITPRERRADRLKIRRKARATQLSREELRRPRRAPVAEVSVSNMNVAGPPIVQEEDGASVHKIGKRRDRKNASVASKEPKFGRRSARKPAPLVESETGLEDRADQIDDMCPLKGLDSTTSDKIEQLSTRHIAEGSVQSAGPSIVNNKAVKRNKKSSDVNPGSGQGKAGKKPVKEKESSRKQKVVPRRDSSQQAGPVAESITGEGESADQIDDSTHLSTGFEFARTNGLSQQSPQGRSEGKALSAKPTKGTSKRQRKKQKILDVNFITVQDPEGLPAGEAPVPGLKSMVDFMASVQKYATFLKADGEVSGDREGAIASNLRKVVPVGDAGDACGIDASGRQIVIRGLPPWLENSGESGIESLENILALPLGTENGEPHGDESAALVSPSLNGDNGHSIPGLNQNLLIGDQETTSQNDPDLISNSPPKDLEMKSPLADDRFPEGNSVADVAGELLSPHLISGLQRLLSAGAAHLNSRPGARNLKLRDLASAADEGPSGGDVKHMGKQRRRRASEAGKKVAGEHAESLGRVSGSMATSSMGNEMAGGARGVKQQPGVKQGTKAGTNGNTKRSQVRGSLEPGTPISEDA